MHCKVRGAELAFLLACYREKDDRAARTHVAVRERRGPAGIRYAAIYPGLRAGRYTIWDVDDTAHQVVTIVGGEVLQVDWS